MVRITRRKYSMNKFRLIRDDKVMYEAIYTFLGMRGLMMSGGSVEADGTVYMGVDPIHGQATFGSVGKDLKKFLGVKKLVLEGHVY